MKMSPLVNQPCLLPCPGVLRQTPTCSAALHRRPVRPCTAQAVQTVEKEAVGLNSTRVSTIVPGPRLTPLLEPPPPVRVVDDNELLSLIDVRAPYCQLQDVQLSADKSYVSCIAVRESLLHGEAHTPMAQWELLRHAANAGEFACAAVNPIKERHYYLSISIGYELNAYEGGAALPQHDLDSTAFKAVQFKAKVMSFNTRTGFASAQIQVFTPDPECAVRHRLYGTFKVKYMALNEAQFQEKFKGMFVSPDRAAELLKEGLSLPSPYLDIVSMSQRRAPSENTRTARLIFDHALMAAGHFPNLPMLAASMALGNMTHAISMFSDGKGGLQRFTTKKHLLKIYGMAMVNDDVNVRCVRVSDTIYDLTLLSASGTPILSVPKYEVVPLP